MKKIFFLLSIFSMIFVSCSNPEEELLGKWFGTSSLSINYFNDTVNENYLSSRVIRSENAATSIIHSFVFSKEGKEEGTFEESIAGLNVSNNDSGSVFVGSNFTGKWYIKDKKLYLFYDDCSLINANDLSIDDQQYLKTKILDKFSSYINMAKNGLEYSISNDGDYENLCIYFGNEEVKFERKKNQ